ncbi:MAG: hypothetical protein R3344_06835, partial [Acidobacteriota bacterium]|nr:hypothetical protein [Acidobacteriota bacterium]
RYATGENGTVRLTSVPPGSWEVLAGSSGTATASFMATAPGAANRVSLPPATDLEVLVPELAGSGSIATVRVVGSDGRPFRSIAWWGSTASEWPMSDGRLEFRSLPPGSWIVRVTAPDGKSWEGTTSTMAGTPAQLTLN